MIESLRVLVVEDEMLVAMLVEDMLTDMGHHPVGPAYRLESGLALAASEELDLAILDVNLGGDLSFGIADVLITRGVPLVFATGYGVRGVDGRFAGRPILAKPFSEAKLSAAVQSAMANGARAA